MAKYVAPAHVSSVFLSRGECAVVDGVIDLPDELSDGDLAGLAANGFVVASDESATTDIKVVKRVSTALDANGNVGKA